VTAAPKPPRDLSLHLAGRASRYTPGPASTRPLSNAPIQNFGVVTPGCVYRSGQPSAAGFAWLKAQGFKSVVCLRKERDDGAAAMARLGFHYLYLPVVDEHAPSKEQAETFLKFAANPENWPLLEHCGGGIGRASCMAALVRYSFDGRRMSVAMHEARHYRPLEVPLIGKQRRFLLRWGREHAPGAARP
jgi:protein tyrosine/serine phosphatase